VPPRVRILDAHKRFGKLEAVRGASLEVQKGEVVLVIGPSGSGKSTLLRCVNRLEHLNSGQIWIDEELVSDPRVDVRHIREEVGMVFQSFNLFPHLSALDNITIGPRIVKKTPKEQAQAAGLKLLERVGLADKVKSYPDQLSGGQPGHEPEGDAVRRAHLRPGPGDDQGGPGRHGAAGQGRHDHAGGFARDGLRPGGGA
jgi:ABC-type polar amino acid transport system ATPase subunit